MAKKKNKARISKKVRARNIARAKRHSASKTINQRLAKQKRKRGYFLENVRARDERSTYEIYDLATGEVIDSKPVEHRTREQYLEGAKDLFIDRFFERIQNFYGDDWEEGWTQELTQLMMGHSAEWLHDTIIKGHSIEAMYYESKNPGRPSYTAGELYDTIAQKCGLPE